MCDIMTDGKTVRISDETRYRAYLERMGKEGMEGNPAQISAWLDEEVARFSALPPTKKANTLSLASACATIGANYLNFRYMAGEIEKPTGTLEMKITFDKKVKGAQREEILGAISSSIPGGQVTVDGKNLEITNKRRTVVQ